MIIKTIAKVKILQSKGHTNKVIAKALHITVRQIEAIDKLRFNITDETRESVAESVDNLEQHVIPSLAGVVDDDDDDAGDADHDDTSLTSPLAHDVHDVLIS